MHHDPEGDLLPRDQPCAVICHILHHGPAEAGKNRIDLATGGPGRGRPWPCHRRRARARCSSGRTGRPGVVRDSLTLLDCRWTGRGLWWEPVRIRDRPVPGQCRPRSCQAWRPSVSPAAVPEIAMSVRLPVLLLAPALLVLPLAAQSIPHARYTIAASLEPELGKVVGGERVSYLSHSPDMLRPPTPRSGGARRTCARSRRPVASTSRASRRSRPRICRRSRRPPRARGFS